MMNFNVDKDKCIQCWMCVSDCPVLIIDGKSEYPEIKENKESLCLKCQHCLAVCPTGAISIWGKNPEDSLPVNDKIPSPNEMEQMIKTRRSIRNFKDEEIDKNLIHNLISTAAYAPTSRNDNAVLFTLVDDKINLSKLRSLTYEHIKKANDENRIPSDFSYINNFQTLWNSKHIDILFRDAPHLLIVSAPKNDTNPETDACIALSYFELLANSNGIGTLWNGYAKWALNNVVPEIGSIVGIPDDHIIVAVLLFGKPAIKYARSIQSDGLNINRVSL